MLRKSLFAIAILTLTSGAAYAEARVGNDLRIDVEVEDVETHASRDGKAETSIGSIGEGARVGNRARIEVEAEDVRTFAGRNAEACTSIGSVGGCVNQMPEKKGGLAGLLGF